MQQPDVKTNNLYSVPSSAFPISALGNTVFVVKQEETLVASFQTDKEGRFWLSLPPGKYRVSKKEWHGRFGSYGPSEIEIGGGQVKNVQWERDSGMH